MDKSNKIENLANKYVERHIRDRHLSDDTIKEIKIAYIMIRRKESIKAYGNAIVPLIAVKIFEMINKIEGYEQQTTL